MGLPDTSQRERELPPSYEEANDPNAPPPSYDSVFGHIKELHHTSNSCIDFLKKLLIILFGTVGCSIVIAITLVIPIAMVFMGSLYLDECPAEHYIPIYLVVGGVFGLLKQLLSLNKKGEPQSGEELKHTLKSSIQSLVDCFLLGWFMAGCFWVYRIFEPVYDDPSAPNYCNKSLYYFAFWLLTATYAIIGLTIVLLCCTSIGFILLHPK